MSLYGVRHNCTRFVKRMNEMNRNREKESLEDSRTINFTC